MLAINRTCSRRGPVLVLDMDFGWAAHGTVRWVMKKGVIFKRDAGAQEGYEGVPESRAASGGVL